MRRNHWQREIARLDPETDFEEISRILATIEFPWDSQQALSFALFRTYAVPTIGQLLFDTAEFSTDTQRRHDDTALILETIAVEGLESPDGRAGVRRMNQMHGSYDISNDDLRYVLATFVVTPQRWIERYGWRSVTPAEQVAGVRYYQRLGALMGIKDIPADFAGFGPLMDAYERETFVFNAASRAVADATMELFVSFYPRPLRPAMRVFSRALLDDHLREAFHYPKPSSLVSALAHGSLRLRGRVVRLLPARKEPTYFRDSGKVRSYPGGFMIERLGTFPATMPDLPDSPGNAVDRKHLATPRVDHDVRLSVLDLVPVRTDQSTGDAIAATVSLAQVADRIGFTRFWVAEHHNMPAVAATSPPVLIAMLGAQTSRIRLGSGGVMLPNHAPLAVAEQFALLEAATPGRIDLGIGRAPGSDPVTSMALRGAAGRDDTDIENFPQYLDDVVALMSAGGVRVAIPRQEYILKATPAATSEPRMWLLGSSMYSAHLAAAKGLPYVFAHHFSGQGTAEALATYRSEFRPSDQAPEPVTFLTVNAAVAESEEEAAALLLPNLQMMAKLRTGQPLTALDLVEDAAAIGLHPQQQAMIEAGFGRSVVGTPETAAQQIRDLASQFGVDEVMVNPVASAHRGTDPRTAPAREHTLELLAKELL